MTSRVCRTAVVLVAATVAGCSGSLIESKKIDYKSATKAPTLEVPPDLISPSRDDRFAVPDSAGRGSATYSAYSADRGPAAQATNSVVLPEVGNDMHIERAGTQRWLVVRAVPDALWPKIKDFWQSLGFVINIETPEAGVMETDWAEDRAKISDGFIRDTIGGLLDSLYSTGERDKFRVRLEPGQGEGTTDIFISHRGMSEVYVSEGKDQTRWQPRQPDPDLEAEMLRRLMVFLGTEESRAKTLLAASGEKPLERARLERTNDGGGALQLSERFDRAWRRVGLALDRIGFTVEDRDRSKGTYFVRYVDPDADVGQKSEGILAKLAFWRPSNKKEAQIQYRVFVGEQGGATLVRVLGSDGRSDTTETGRRILSLLHEQLK